MRFDQVSFLTSVHTWSTCEILQMRIEQWPSVSKMADSVVSLDCTAIGSILLKIVGERADRCNRPLSIGSVGDGLTALTNRLQIYLLFDKKEVQHSPNCPSSSETTEPNIDLEIIIR